MPALPVFHVPGRPPKRPSRSGNSAYERQKGRLTIGTRLNESVRQDITGYYLIHMLDLAAKGPAACPIPVTTTPITGVDAK